MEVRFKLNPNNEKDRVIIELLQAEYSPNESIKSILYRLATNGIQGISMSFGGNINNVNVCTAMLNNPTNDLSGHSEDDMKNEFSDFF